MRALKILLTGATGFIGTNFVLRLYKDYKITALVRSSSDTSKIEKYCEIYRFDESDESSKKNEKDKRNKNGQGFKELESLFENSNFDGVLHLGGLVPSTSNPVNDFKELINANITFGTELLEASKGKIKFFINASSYALYCNSLTYRPATLYAASKKAFEDIMSFYALSNEGTVYTNLLIFNVYGPNCNKTYIFTLFEKMAKSGEVLEMSDGTQIVDYSHVFDVVEGFSCLIKLCLKEPEKAKNKIFALKGAERLSLKELVALYEKLTKQKLNIIWGARKRKPLDVIMPWQGGEILPNFKAKISFEEGFKSL